MAKFFLIHGAWLGAWTWRYITPILLSQGHQVIAIDLPGAGNDLTLIKDINFDLYVKTVVKLIDAQDEKIILVGHSMAGMIISAVAEIIPHKIKSLIYLCAFLPQNEQSLWDIVTDYVNDNVQLEFSLDDSLCAFKQEFITNAFFNCCEDKDIALAKSLMDQYQASNVFHKKITLTNENYGQITKTYIKCTKDNAITIKMQNDMLHKQPVNKIYSIHTDHCPFFSSPKKLANILIVSCQEPIQL